MFEALAGGPFAPATEAGRLEGFPHMSDDLAFFQTGDFSNLFECDAVCPGGPNDPIGAVLGWLGLFDPGYGKFGLLGLHQSILNTQPSSRFEWGKPSAYSTRDQVLSE